VRLNVLHASGDAKKYFSSQSGVFRCNLFTGPSLLRCVARIVRSLAITNSALNQPADTIRPNPQYEVKKIMTKNQFNALLLTAALSGLVGGTSVAAKAATSGSNHANGVSAGVVLVSQDKTPNPKHSCKGKNDCKGVGGCSTGDKGCKGKNTCKGKGGCATDGSTPPKAV